MTEPLRPLLCLDLEGTLISNAVSQIPRPELYRFLERVSVWCDLMIYTSVSQDRVTSIQKLMVAEGEAPPWFQFLPVICTSGTLKPKSACRREDAYLLDDQSRVIVPGEEGWWISIPEYLPPYDDDDRALSQALDRIKARIYDA